MGRKVGKNDHGDDECCQVGKNAGSLAGVIARHVFRLCPLPNYCPLFVRLSSVSTVWAIKPSLHQSYRDDTVTPKLSEVRGTTEQVTNEGVFFPPRGKADPYGREN